MTQKRRRRDPSTITDQMLTHHHYPTKSQFVRHALRYLHNLEQRSLYRAAFDRPLRILDHSCGTSVWNAVAQEIWPDSYRVNVEYQIASPIRREVAHEWHFGMPFQLWAENYLHQFRAHGLHYPLFDIVLGNGPFKELQAFFEWGYRLLRLGGLMYNLAPINFLGTQDRTATLHRVLRPTRVITIPKRLSFTKDGHTDEKEYVLFLHMRHDHQPPYTILDFDFDWHDDSPDLPEDQIFAPLGTANDQPSFLDLWQGEELEVLA